MRAREFRPFVLARSQRGPQPALAPRRELEQFVLGEIDQRRSQQRGEREVVVRQQREAPERDQVGDRDLIHQHHAVGARDGHAVLHELADHLAREFVAPSDQDHDVAGPDRRAAFRQRDAVVEPAPDAFGELGRENHLRALRQGLIDRPSTGRAPPSSPPSPRATPRPGRSLCDADRAGSNRRMT